MSRLTFAVALWLVPVGFGQTTRPVEKPADAVQLFDGTSESETANWAMRKGQPAAWPVADGAMSSMKQDLVSKEKYTDFKMHVEFCEPVMADTVKGQERGNSGVYLQGRYEIQVLDSYGLPPSKVDCGAVYNQTAPSENACKPPGQWQTYDIEFHAAKWDGKTRTDEARVTVVHNGAKILDDVKIHGVTGSEYMKETPEPGPIMLQYHHNSVQFCNVWVEPLK